MYQKCTKRHVSFFNVSFLWSPVAIYTKTSFLFCFVFYYFLFLDKGQIATDPSLCVCVCVCVCVWFTPHALVYKIVARPFWGLLNHHHHHDPPYHSPSRRKRLMVPPVNGAKVVFFTVHISCHQLLWSRVLLHCFLLVLGGFFWQGFTYLNICIFNYYQENAVVAIVVSCVLWLDIISFKQFCNWNDNWTSSNLFCNYIDAKALRLQLLLWILLKSSRKNLYVTQVAYYSWYFTFIQLLGCMALILKHKC